MSNDNKELDKELDPGTYCKRCHVVPVKDEGDVCPECQAAEADVKESK